jgi:hypothetical protein
VSLALAASDCLEVVQGLKGKNLGRSSYILLEIAATARQHGEVSFRRENCKNPPYLRLDLKKTTTF